MWVVVPFWTKRRSWLVLAAAWLLLLAAGAARAADPERGAQLFFNAPRSGMLSCADCHGENPQQNNFGNIWSGRNAPQAIGRAISINTGGMGVFQGLYGSSEQADIAAFLGTFPRSIDFGTAALNTSSAGRSVTVASSIRAGLSGISLRVEGDFFITSDACGAALQRFSTCTVELAFRPTGTGERSGALFIAHSDTPTPVRVRLLGSGPTPPPPPPPIATVVPAALEFGSAALGLASAPRLAELRNDGNTALRVSAIATSLPDFVHAGGTCAVGTVLASGQRCTVALRFEPRAGTGARNGRLEIAHNGAAGGSSVALSATATAATTKLAFEPTALHLDFGVLPGGATSPARELVLRNVGSAIAQLSALDTSDAAFVLQPGECSAGRALAPRETCRARLAFQPGRNVPFSGLASVAAADGSRSSATLAGLGSENASAAQLWPPRWAGAQATGQTRSALWVLNNRGATAVRPREWALLGPDAGEYSINGRGSCRIGVALLPGTSCTLGVDFTPRSVGTKGARLQVALEGVAAPLVAELLGTAAAAPAPQLLVSDSSVDFGNVALDPAGSPQFQVLLRNAGAAPLAWQQLGLAGAGAGEFEIGGDCRQGTPLAAGASCRVTLNFWPGRSGLRQPGPRSATLVLWPQGQDAAHEVSLNGQALQAPPPERELLSEDRGANTAAPLAWERAASPYLVGTAALGEHVSDVELQPTLVNRGSAPSAPLRWHIAGAHAGDFSIDPASTCVSGQPLPAGARCSLRVAFHPSAAGLRTARLALGTSEAAGAWLEAIVLQGRAFAPATALLRTEPAQLAVAARPGAAVALQRAWVQNSGAALLRVESVALQGSGIALATGPADDRCAAAPFVLSPGQRCAVDLQWDGSASAAAAIATGTALRVASNGGEAVVPVVVTEDPVLTSNTGTGGGAIGSPLWLLGLLAVALFLARERARESKHD